MKKILVIGATGQIGSELVPELRKQYGNDNVVAGFIESNPPSQEMRESGPSIYVDVRYARQIAAAVKLHEVDAIYNLAALLSVVAESYPKQAWDVGINGLWNVLDVAKELHCSVFTPSSIGAFGENTPHDMTPQDTIQRPKSVYGISKVTTELLSDYYFQKFGVDTRSVRFPGLISYVAPPGGGTTDYAVDIYYHAVKGETFHCPIPEGVKMDMMYMPDALRAAITIMEANPDKLVHRNSFNVASMSFAPETVYAEICKHIPDFKMVYDVDPLKESIARSWPDRMDDSCAQEEWGWKAEYDLPRMTEDMLAKLNSKFQNS